MLCRHANPCIFDRIYGLATWEQTSVTVVVEQLLTRDMSGEALCARGHHLLGTVSDGLVGLTDADPDRVRAAAVAIVFAPDAPKRRAFIDALVQSDPEQIAQVEELLRVSAANIDAQSWDLATQEAAMELAGIR